ncbi:MAG TPA: hypothetical protein VKQ36_13765 [Ktedonobacterales bacterium]|nr:hypothetical protein [Ktedonobacterales bacterium]
MPLTMMCVPAGPVFGLTVTPGPWPLSGAASAVALVIGLAIATSSSMTGTINGSSGCANRQGSARLWRGAVVALPGLPIGDVGRCGDSDTLCVCLPMRWPPHFNP